MIWQPLKRVVYCHLATLWLTRRAATSVAHSPAVWVVALVALAITVGRPK